MRSFYKVFFKFLKSHDLIEKWLISVKTYYIFRRASKILVNSLLNYINDDLFQKTCNKFHRKVYKFAHKNNITFVNIFNVYDYVLKHSDFKDNPDYSITRKIATEDYLNDFIRNIQIFQNFQMI